MNKFLFAILFSDKYCCPGPGSINQTSLFKSISADSLSYLNPKDYIIGGITVTGQIFDKDVLITISKLKRRPINLRAKLMQCNKEFMQGFFDDVQLNVTSINMDTIYLEIAVQNSRLSKTS